MRFQSVYAALIGLVCAHPALAALPQPGNQYSTAYLQSLCNSQYDIDAGLCAGYIMGVAASLQQANQACFSPQIGPEILHENVRRAWDQMPDQPADALQSIQAILQSRFPCP